MFKKVRPYTTWTSDELRQKLENDINYHMDVHFDLKSLWVDIVREAFSSKDWDAINDYNGCSIVQDPLHPCPACFVHDYMWITGRGGSMSDKIFYYLMKAEGLDEFTAIRRWLGVRIGWYVYFKWKYIRNRNLKKPTLAMSNLFEYFKK